MTDRSPHVPMPHWFSRIQLPWSLTEAKLNAVTVPRDQSVLLPVVAERLTAEGPDTAGWYVTGGESASLLLLHSKWTLPLFHHEWSTGPRRSNASGGVVSTEL